MIDRFSPEELLSALPNGRDLRVLARKLGERGFSLYLVGGAVRDVLLGRTPKDVDLLVVHPKRDRKAFAKAARNAIRGPVREVGHAFPIHLLRFRGKTYEVTFSNVLKSDLRRRDFSVNSLAFDLRGGALIDFFGGLQDLQEMRLSPTVSAQKTFEDDPVRILRAARMVAAGFVPCEALQVGADNFARDLEDATPERLGQEWQKMFDLQASAKALRWLHERRALDHLVPEWAACRAFAQHNPHHTDTVDEHILQVMAELDAMGADGIVKQAAFFHDIGKPNTFLLDEKGIGHFYGHEEEGAKIALRNLRFMRLGDFETSAVKSLVELHMRPHQARSAKAARRLAMQAGPLWPGLLQLHAADRLAHAGAVPDEVFSRIEVLKAAAHDIAPKTFGQRDLALKGGELLAAGLSSREVGLWKERLAEAVVEGTVPNEEAALMAYFLRLRQAH